MRIVIIGGTRFIGTFVVKKLAEMGHDILVFSRQQSNNHVSNNIKHLVGNTDDLSTYGDEFKRFSPNAVVDMIAYTKRDAEKLVHTFKGITKRLVVISSQDVYRAYGLIKHLEDGELQPLPITEESTVRSYLHPYGGNYEKILVEQTIMSEPEVHGTILRLPGVYGPQDPFHRFHWIIKRIYDQRPAIVLQKEYAQFRQTHGYVENVADAICLAATNENACDRIYNVGEKNTLSSSDWVSNFGNLMGWNGRIVEVDAKILPKSMVRDFRMDQHWIVSSDRIRTELGYKENVSFSEGLQRTSAWELSNSSGQPILDYSDEDSIYAQISK